MSENVTKSIVHEDRVDEFAIQAFKGMGHSTRLPDSTVLVYNEFKRRKDKLRPGRLTHEGFAFVSVLGDILEGNIAVSSNSTASKSESASETSEEDTETSEEDTASETESETAVEASEAKSKSSTKKSSKSKES